MSHAATNWLSSLDPELMTHGEFRAMFYLCDCHNPAMGCFPSQKYLQRRTGLSGSGLNKALRSLEDKGLIARALAWSDRTGSRECTRYTLGFELPPEGVDQNGNEGANPTALSGVGGYSSEKRSNGPKVEGATPPSGVVLAKPVNEPVNEPCGDAATISGDLVSRFLDAYPRAGSAARVEERLGALVASGVAFADILAGAVRYAAEQEGNAARFIKLPCNWLDAKGWEVAAPVKRARRSDDEVRATLAANVKEERGYLLHSVPAWRFRDLIDRGMVTAEECQRAGVRL